MGCEWNFSFVADVLVLFTKGNSATIRLESCWHGFTFKKSGFNLRQSARNPDFIPRVQGEGSPFSLAGVEQKRGRSRAWTGSSGLGGPQGLVISEVWGFFALRTPLVLLLLPIVQMRKLRPRNGKGFSHSLSEFPGRVRL